MAAEAGLWMWDKEWVLVCTRSGQGHSRVPSPSHSPALTYSHFYSGRSAAVVTNMPPAYIVDPFIPSLCAEVLSGAQVAVMVPNVPPTHTLRPLLFLLTATARVAVVVTNSACAYIPGPFEPSNLQTTKSSTAVKVAVVITKMPPTYILDLYNRSYTGAVSNNNGRLLR